jgi:hypothetical protein
MVDVFPLPAHRARLVRLLACLVVSCGMTGTSLLCLGSWRWGFLSPLELFGLWLALIALPVVAVLGLLWAFTAPKVQT